MKSFYWLNWQLKPTALMIFNNVNLRYLKNETKIILHKPKGYAENGLMKIKLN